MGVRRNIHRGGRRATRLRRSRDPLSTIRSSYWRTIDGSTDWTRPTEAVRTATSTVPPPHCSTSPRGGGSIPAWSSSVSRPGPRSRAERWTTRSRLPRMTLSVRGPRSGGRARAGSLGRYWTHFEARASRAGEDQFAEAFLAAANARAYVVADLPEWLAARIELSLHARQQVGERVSRDQNARDNVLAFAGLYRGRFPAATDPWLRPSADADITASSNALHRLLGRFVTHSFMKLGLASLPTARANRAVDLGACRIVRRRRSPASARARSPCARTRRPAVPAPGPQRAPGPPGRWRRCRGRPPRGGAPCP